MASSRVFLLSPANTGGERGRLLLNPLAQFDLAVRLRNSGATIAEIYSFISALYFRGKMAYVDAFAARRSDVLVITPGAGLVSPGTLITQERLQSLAAVDIHAGEPLYREPLERDARQLLAAYDSDCEFVLLGSIATGKYTEPLLECFGTRLVFPEAFVGRGDMSRGGLMLRSARDRAELTYVPVQGAVRRGQRPPRLPKLPRLVRF